MLLIYRELYLHIYCIVFYVLFSKALGITFLAAGEHLFPANNRGKMLFLSCNFCSSKPIV